MYSHVGSEINLLINQPLAYVHQEGGNSGAGAANLDPQLGK